MGLLDGWRFCPRCGAGAEVTREERLVCGACGHVVWATPSVAAMALCEDDAGRVLLARRAHDPARGKWDVPGGFVGEGEHPLDALRRELVEETGLRVEPTAFLGVWVDDYVDEHAARKVVALYWTAVVLAGEPRAADDVAELRWFGRGELPAPDAIGFATVADVLEAWSRR